MLDNLLKRKSFWNVYIFSLFVLSAFTAINDQEVSGAIFFGLITCITLILFSDLTPSILPVLLLSAFVTECYDSAATFLSMWYYGLFLVAAVIFHLLKYKRKITIGPSFSGIVAVTVAVTLGGLGSISRGEYLSPTSLYYVFSLGLGTLLFYLLFSNHFSKSSAYHLAQIMYAVGLFASFLVLLFLYLNRETLLDESKTLLFQASNNLSTFIMLSLPFPMYFGKKRGVDVFATLFMYFCAIISTSRAAIIFATLELIIIFVCYICFFERKKLLKFFYIAVLVALGYVFLKILPEIVENVLYASQRSENFGLSETFDAIKNFFTSPNESRGKLLKRALEDFKSNKIFGVGLGYTGNSDIYAPKSGAMNWYHMWTAQILGSMGLVGVLAFLYQLFVRIKIYFKNTSPLNMTFLLSYVGLFLMSQVNPGEFCPLPYGILATVYFILMEKKS
ncbi:MAG: O-antigen ligase family protein [Ruminococcaceae bacterium]|nr:O-antigen ligase family protein [Oscillospiraceae bacterium]